MAPLASCRIANREIITVPLSRSERLGRDYSVGLLASELRGGAGVAASRLHAQLLRNGVVARLYYRRGTAGPGCHRVEFADTTGKRISERISNWILERSRVPTTTLVSRTTLPFSTHIELLSTCDVINLHWISKWADWESLFRSIPHKIPLVLTLHDASFFTGLCHQPDGCDKFETTCGRCPKMKSRRYDPSARWHRLKKRLYQNRPLHIVPNSSWTRHLAEGASAFQNAQIHDPIPPGIDFSEFTIVDRNTARELLGIPKHRPCVGFGSVETNDRNKGGDLLERALRRVTASVGELTLLVFGTGQPQVDIEGVTVKHVGFVESPSFLKIAYSACDVFVVPSRMETFGLTALESIACGTPIVCFQTGGLVDIVQPETNGALCELEDVDEMARAIRRHCEAAETSAREAVRQSAAHFSIEDCAARYQELFATLASHNGTHAPVAH